MIMPHCNAHHYPVHLFLPASETPPAAVTFGTKGPERHLKPEIVTPARKVSRYFPSFLITWFGIALVQGTRVNARTSPDHSPWSETIPVCVPNGFRVMLGGAVYILSAIAEPHSSL